MHFNVLHCSASSLLTSALIALHCKANQFEFIFAFLGVKLFLGTSLISVMVATSVRGSYLMKIFEYYYSFFLFYYYKKQKK